MLYLKLASYRVLSPNYRTHYVVISFITIVIGVSGLGGNKLFTFSAFVHNYHGKRKIDVTKEIDEFVIHGENSISPRKTSYTVKTNVLYTGIHNFVRVNLRTY